jgi:excisionase family DNA binding protein
MNSYVVEDDLEQYANILTPAEVADILNVHINTIYKLLNSSSLVGFRMGHAWRIRKKELIAFLQNGGSQSI